MYVLCTIIFILITIITQLTTIPKKNGALTVVCTTSIIADTVKNIAGNHVQVISLMGPGVDPHLYKAVEHDVIALAQADIIFFNGLHLEARMAQVLEHMTHTHSYNLSNAIPRDKLIIAQQTICEYDPHIWFDIQLWKSIARFICTTLCTSDKQHEQDFQKNCDIYCQKLDLAHTKITDMLLNIPQEKRILITGHDAFSYFARAYNFKIISLQGVSTESSPGAHDIAQIIQTILDTKIPTIFIENSIPIKNIQAIAQGVEARHAKVNIGNELFADSLSETSGPAGTYITMIEHNAKVITDGLQQ